MITFWQVAELLSIFKFRFDQTALQLELLGTVVKFTDSRNHLKRSYMTEKKARRVLSRRANQSISAKLEIEPCAELHYARLIKSGVDTAKGRARDIHIRTKGRILFIQHVEGFHTQLQTHPFTKAYVLAQSGIPVVIGQAVDKVTRQIPGLSCVIEEEYLSRERSRSDRAGSDNL